jgi:hypothetical protein
LATATVLVTTLTNLLTNLFNTLKTVLLNALNSPLLSLGSLDISTVAQSGSKNAAKVVGAVSGLKVLGTDVIKTVTGSSTIDLLDLVGSTLSQVQGAISTVTNQLTTVLDNVLGLTVPLPTVAVLTKSTSLDKVGADTSALATVTGLTFKWAGLLSQQEVIPRAAVAPLAVSFGDPFSIEAKIATLADQSSYTTVAATTPTTVTPGNTPDLANTGLPVGVSVTAALMLLAAYAVRRFRRSEKFLTATD